jgi:hypothetical protein
MLQNLGKKNTNFYAIAAFVANLKQSMRESEKLFEGAQRQRRRVLPLEQIGAHFAAIVTAMVTNGSTGIERTKKINKNIDYLKICYEIERFMRLFAYPLQDTA